MDCHLDGRKTQLLDLPNETLHVIFRLATSCNCCDFPQESYKGQSVQMRHFFPTSSLPIDLHAKTKRTLVLVSRKTKTIAYPFLHEVVSLSNEEELSKFVNLMESRALDPDGGFGRFVKALSVMDECYHGLLRSHSPSDAIHRMIARVLRTCRSIEMLQYQYEEIINPEWPMPLRLDAAHEIWNTIPSSIWFLRIPETRYIPQLSTAQVSEFLASHSKLKYIDVGNTGYNEHIHPALLAQITHLSVQYLDGDTGTYCLDLPSLKAIFIDEFNVKKRLPRICGSNGEFSGVLSVEVSRYQAVLAWHLAAILKYFPNMQELTYWLNCEDWHYGNAWSTMHLSGDGDGPGNGEGEGVEGGGGEREDDDEGGAGGAGAGAGGEGDDEGEGNEDEHEDDQDEAEPVLNTIRPAHQHNHLRLLEIIFKPSEIIPEGGIHLVADPLYTAFAIHEFCVKFPLEEQLAKERFPELQQIRAVLADGPHECRIPTKVLLTVKEQLRRWIPAHIDFHLVTTRKYWPDKRFCNCY